MEEYDIKKKILTPEEVRDILRSHFGLPSASVYFKVDAVEDPADWNSQYPLDYQLTKIVIKQEEAKKETCQYCTNPPKNAHSCPFQEEIKGNFDVSFCNCCDSCISQCKNSV